MTASRREKLIGTARLAFCIGVFLTAAFLLMRLVDTLKQHQTYKVDLAEITHVRYGLLDADTWAEVVTTIISKRIDAFQLSPDSRQDLEESISGVLDEIILEIDAIVRKRNNQGGFFERTFGSARQYLTDILFDIHELKKDLPKFSKIILEELSQPENKQRLKAYLHASINEFSTQTFAETDRSRFRAVLATYDCRDTRQCRELLTDRLAELSGKITATALAVLGLFALLFAFVLIGVRTVDPPSMLLLTLSCLALLAGGITTPMIEIQAEISELRFQLIGEPVVFQDQVLYFQSKSITDVVAILAQTGKIDMILVGGLITLFSIVFPALKLVSSFGYYFNLFGLRSHRLIRYFTLRSGKWSMADVMVVALFMAFIGFSGLISSQLSHLGSASRHVEVLTTNGTNLQVGFFLFLSFCLASLFLSGALDKIGKDSGLD